MGRSICLATIDFKGLVPLGGIGTYYDELARLLSNNGWNVVVLFHHADRDTRKSREQYFKQTGIPIYDVNEICREGNVSLDEIWNYSNWHQARSRVFHEALQVLIRKYKYKFDLVEFPEWGAPGFASVRINKNLKDYKDSPIIVKLHSPSQWHREGSLEESVTFEDLRLDYMEKYSFENADIQVAPTHHILEWCQQHGWSVRNDAHICPNPIEGLKLLLDKADLSQKRGRAKLDEIVFFGRFEERKGVFDFIRALNHIVLIDPAFSKRCKIVFMGIEAQVSQSDIAESLREFQINFRYLPRDEALRFLRERACLVVAPSRADNYPNTVLECMYAEIPFITSRAGGIPEMLKVGSRLYEDISCDTTQPAKFGGCILEYLNRSEKEIEDLVGLARQRVEEITDPQNILSWYEKRACERGTWVKSESLAETSLEARATVTVIIPYYNAHQYIERTLESLFNQTYKNFKIILVNDGSTYPESILMLEHIKQRYPSMTILDKENEGPGSARNYALRYTDTEYVVPVDADNIAKPEMLQTFVECIRNHSDVAALSCDIVGFKDSDEEVVMASLFSSKRFAGHWGNKFLGPCLPLLFFENCQGDTIGIYRTEVVKSVGGWPEDRDGCDDWALWIKLLANGHRVDVVPLVLYYHRDRATSETKTRRVIGIDNTNLKFIRLLLEKEPRQFFFAYVGLHRFIRRSGSATQPSVSLTGGLIKAAVQYYKRYGLIQTIRKVIQVLK